MSSNMNFASADNDSVGNIYAAKEEDAKSDGESPSAPVAKRQRVVD